MAVAGSATLLLVALPQSDAAGAAHTLRNLLLGSLAASGLLILGELWGFHPSQDAVRAAHSLMRGGPVGPELDGLGCGSTRARRGLPWLNG